jgi:site-specific DNA recombinase
MDKLNVIGYVRVSMPEQKTRGYGIEIQRDLIQKQVELKGWNLLDIYENVKPGITSEREGLEKLISDVENKKTQAIVVYKLDRLSRKMKDIMYLIEDVFIKNNIKIVSITENIDTSTPLGIAMIGMISVFSQLERENIKARMHEGILKKASKGGYVGGVVPYGYYIEKDKYVINQEQSTCIKRVFELRIKALQCVGESICFLNGTENG